MYERSLITLSDHLQEEHTMNSSYLIFASATLYDSKVYILDLESCFDVSKVECVS